MKKIVITGATSFIGIHLIQEWLKEQCEIFAVVRPNSENIDRIPQNVKIHVMELEMLDYDKLPDIINKADFFYHLAWEGARVPYRDDKILQRKNYDCTLKAYEVAVKMGCNFFLGSGSQAEYGVMQGLVDETYPCNPITEYGKEKLHAYEELEKRTQESNIRFIWTRIFSIYGKYDYSKTLIMSAIDKMLRNEPVEMTLCTQLWDYLNVEDAARAMKMFALKQCDNGVYNIASGDYKALKEFVKIVKEVINSKSELKFGAVKYGTNGPTNLTPDVRKIMESLDWKPEVEFGEGIKKIVQCKFEPVKKSL